MVESISFWPQKSNATNAFCLYQILEKIPVYRIYGLCTGRSLEYNACGLIIKNGTFPKGCFGCERGAKNSVFYLCRILQNDTLLEIGKAFGKPSYSPADSTIERVKEEQPSSKFSHWIFRLFDFNSEPPGQARIGEVLVCPSSHISRCSSILRITFRSLIKLMIFIST